MKHRTAPGPWHGGAPPTHRPVNSLVRWFAIICRAGEAVARLAVRAAVNGFQGRRTPFSRIVARTFVQFAERSGPTCIKIAQILSTRKDLFDDGVLEELRRLQDRVAPMPGGMVPALVRREFGVDLHSVFPEFDHQPIASASIATVYRARLRDGTPVAVKVRRPSVVRQMRGDLRLGRAIASALARLPALRLVPVLTAVDDISRCLERQLDFRLEVAAVKRLRLRLAGDAGLVLPAPIESLCSDSIITMELLGACQAEACDDAGARAALLVALRALFKMIFVEGFVHCDMHQGNLHLTADGRAVLVDFGFMAEMSTADRLQFAAFFLAVATNDWVSCVRIIRDTATLVPPRLDVAAFETDVRALVTSVSGAAARDFQVSDFVIRLFDIQRRFGIRGTSGFTMAILALLVFEGVVKERHADLDFQREALPFLIAASFERVQSSASKFPDVSAQRS
jgi:ubiquinone biosynthesis protein